MADISSFTYEPLKVDQVRWYWNKQPFNLKAVHQLDVQSRSQLMRYCEEDSNHLEQQYRLRSDELEKAWWNEQAELSSGPAAAGKGAIPEEEAASTQWQDYVLGEREGEVGLLVKAGLHEVDMVKRRMQPCYWPGTLHRVIRGSWYVDKGSGYAPLKETVADELEEAFRSHIWDPNLRHVQKQKQGVTAARVELTSLFTKGQYALFVSDSEAYLCTDTTFGSWFARKGTPPGAKLRRGYLPPRPSDKQVEIEVKQEEVDNYCARVPVNRLVLACHGIGQKLAVSNIAHDAACMRLIMRQLSQDTMSKEQHEDGRVEVLPVQWRKHLTLEVDAISEALMPAGVRGLRSMFHATAVEVLLYLTPIHCQDMLDSLTTSMNATFFAFMKRNPAFKGKVSLLAHSLGSVLCYEILCNQPHLFDHLEFNIHNTDSPTDAFQSSVAQTQSEQSTHLAQLPSKLQQKQQQKRQASTEIVFAPMSSSDLDGSMVPPSSYPPYPRQSVRSQGAMSQSLGSTATPSCTAEESKLRAENGRLQLELEAVRADRERLLSSQQATTSGQTAPGWQLPALPKPISQQQPQESGEGSLLPPHMDIKPLLFPVDNFICIGSPLGLFLALRGVDPTKGRALGTTPTSQSKSSHTSDGLPAANRIYNLYQPYDPVAYRMEPLIVAGGEKRKPVFAPYYKGGRRLHIGMAEFAEDFGGSVSKAALGSVSVMRMAAGYLGKAVIASKVAKQTEKAGVALDPASAAAAAAEQEDLDAEEGTPADEADVESKSNALESAIWRLTAGKGDIAAGPLLRSGGSSEVPSGAKAGEPVSERKTAAGRVDFVLQDSPTENAYLAAIKAHFCYWSSYDTALFILRAVYGVDVLQESRYASKTKPAKDVPADKSSMPESREEALSVPQQTRMLY